ncbi:MAG: cadmium-translocating P-type ATPase [Actinobacteria bacterium]|nr:cadmium-translocating P-type ATPase [Actinomycetota bacterium]
MTADCCDDCASSPAEKGSKEQQTRRLRDVHEIRASALAGVALIIGFASGAVGQEGLALGAYAAALVTGGSTFIPQSSRALVRGRLSVATLMTIAAVGAVILGEVGEAATLAFLFSISEALESYALTRTRQGLRALLELTPPEATVLQDDGQLSVDPQLLEVGQVMLVRPGERIATDGFVRSGRSALDMSAITGESVPVEVQPGDDVYAASINGRGVLEVEVTATSADNSLARIVRIVEEAQERKGRSQRLAERVARPLVPGVMIVAALIALLGSIFGSPLVWIERALVVLVAAAPCAFAISVPVTVVAAVGAATRAGVLIKGGVALEALASVRALALDKTGTLTRNEPQVIEVIPANGFSQDEVLSFAGALEARSEHPLAKAILDKASPREEASEVEAVAGSGLMGKVGDEEVRLGRPGFIDAQVLEPDVTGLQDAGATVVLVERSGALLGAVGVRDELRDEVSDVVSALKGFPLRLSKITMLTGDNQRTATALADSAGIDEVAAELLPEDKVRAIEESQRQHPTAMVGDGINDAPALATASVGIAMGAVGSDVAIEAADVALMGEDLHHLPQALHHARRSMSIMRQNLTLSASILLVLIPLAALGVMGLAAVVAVHELAELVVIGNGLRANLGLANSGIRRDLTN